MTDRQFRIVVPGQPIAQPRRTVRINWPSNERLRSMRSVEQLRASVHTQPFVPKNHPVHAYRQAIQLLGRRAWPGGPIGKGVPLRLDLRLVFRRPKSMTRKTLPNPKVWHPAKPDADNVCKAVKDALSGIVFHDDNQVACESVAKFYAAGDEQPHTVIEIRELT